MRDGLALRRVPDGQNTHLIEEVLRVLVTEVLAAADDLVEVRVHELVAGQPEGTRWLRDGHKGRSWTRCGTAGGTAGGRAGLRCVRT